uniref:Unannotated protein n=1 Tax=freshwater metagenome TaxID=449393 RepID=A0A6J5ZG53_9ZZZZ
MGKLQRDIFDCELLVVTGKGGVGKTTVSAALGLAAAQRGRDVLLAEVAGQSRIPYLIGHASSTAAGEEQRLTPEIAATTIDPEVALVEWAGRLIRPRALLDIAVKANSFSGFINAAPGGRELLTIAKAYELGRDERWDDQADGYELVILDAPASGHALAMLKTPSTFAEIARVGPIASQAREVETMLGDPARCSIVLVTTLEETPVNETLELEAGIAAQLGRGVDLIVANGLADDGLTDSQVDALPQAMPDLAGEVVSAVATLHARERLQREQLQRLVAGAVAPVIELPAITGHSIGSDEIEQLAAAIGADLPPAA